MKRLLALLSLTAMITAGVMPSRSGSSVVLDDGRVVEGIDVRREGDLVLVTLATGEVVTLPASAVREIRLGGEPPSRTPPTGLTEGPPQQLAGQPAAGLVDSGPAQLAGTPVPPPQTSDQLAVFGGPAKWARDPVESTFHATEWQMDPPEANWNPSKWATAPTDPTWVPTSGFDTTKDVLAPSRSTWRQGSTPSAWVPTDGFKKN